MTDSNIAVVQPQAQLADFALNSEIRDQDVILVMAVEAEDRLNEERGQIEAQLKQLEAKIRTNNDRIGAIGDEVTTAFDLSADEAIAKAVSGIYGKYTAKKATGSADVAKKHYTVDVTIEGSGGRRNSYEATLLNRTVTVPFTAEARKLVKANETVAQEMTGFQSRLLAIRSDLSNLPKYEKRLNAQLIRTKLGTSARGQQVLADLGKVRGPLSLPAPSAA